jgi:glycosyltransferase involved in cell wall biosynthesis
VIIEALASGRPVLGTALGGIPYLVGADAPRVPAGTGPATAASAVPGAGPAALPPGIEAGEAGWVVPPDPAALAAAFPVTRAGAAGLAPAARLRYERTFHPDVVTKQLIDIYAGVARTARPA